MGMSDTDVIGCSSTSDAGRQAWRDRGLPDPIQVPCEERITERLHGLKVRHPGRDALDAWFAMHGEDEMPSDWRNL
jgi:hypothetical protein